MKISTYHKSLGYEVVFYKGDLKQFVIDRIADRCVAAFTKEDKSIDWYLRKHLIAEFIRTGKKEAFDKLVLEDSERSMTLSSKAIEYKDYYKKGTWEKEPEWDRVFVTTLFTFYWDITVDTILFAKKLVKKRGLFMVGGVLATIQAKELEEKTGVTPHKGLLNTPGELDPGDEQIIDNLPLDYSILDEVGYEYPMSNAFYGYTTRGCIRKCSFCAVPTLEPVYMPYLPLRERVEQVRETYGDQKDLLLMDNNILASENLEDIIQDIVDSGFGVGAKFKEPDHLEIAMRNLSNNVNDRAYRRKGQKLMLAFYDKLEAEKKKAKALKEKKEKELAAKAEKKKTKDASDAELKKVDEAYKSELKKVEETYKLKVEEFYQIYRAVSNYNIKQPVIPRKKELLAAYEEVKDLNKKYFRPSTKDRYIDFNQGVDARLFTEKNVELLGRINIRPLRIAFDHMETREPYENAIRMSARVG
ncbi:MAG: hypothetical protein LUG98_01420, partial [Tannerellaceae bacterium]|nr:hypothetical protein [Tannerellaceae bacterium]